MKYQVMPDLTPIEYEALKADIAENGVLVPVEVDEGGDLLDGHHRVRAWQELRSEGVTVPDYPRMVRRGMSEEQKRNHARRLNVLRRQLTKEQRDAVIVAMRQDGMSQPAIAQSVGVTQQTVSNVLSGYKKLYPDDLPTTITGADGKTYPAQQAPRPAPPPSLFVEDDDDEEPEPLRYTDGLARCKYCWEIHDRWEYSPLHDEAAWICGYCDHATADEYMDLRTAVPAAPVFVPGGAVDIDSKSARQQVKQENREKIESKRAAAQAERAKSTIATDSSVWHGDMRNLCHDIAENSVDLILTDPPYPAEYLPLFSDLSVFAERVLKPGGLCLVYSGQIFLPEVLYRLGQRLEYVWTFAIRHTGGNQRIFKANVNTGWKPVFAYCKPPLDVWWDSFIDVVSGGREKDLHEWQQAEAEAAYFIEHLTLPGQMVVDPFCGSGTVLQAAKRLGRQYIGIEIDEVHANRAAGRLE